jgi:UDP-N-acetylmuramate dehydrogenase
MSLMSHVPDSISFLADYPLQAHNTFGFDVRARLLCRIEHEAQLLAAVRDSRDRRL